MCGPRNRNQCLKIQVSSGGCQSRVCEEVTRGHCVGMLCPKQSSGIIHATLEVRDGLTVQQLVMQCLADCDVKETRSRG